MSFVRTKYDVDGVHYDPQYDIIHIDEKWFRVDKKTRRVFTSDEEALIHRSIRNANYIKKCMFLCAVARPQRPQGWVGGVDDPDDWVFGGKVGLYPLVEETEARRGDRRTGLQRGDIIVKPISITGATFEAVLVDRLLPDIAANCPQSMKSRPITIQLDNASPHKVD